jgi:peptidoglycan/xylan/chitin deacetylase (PgdA/CDA1 family)
MAEAIFMPSAAEPAGRGLAGGHRAALVARGATLERAVRLRRAHLLPRSIVVFVHRSIRRAIAWLPAVAILAAGCRDNTVTNPVDDGQDGLPAAEERVIGAPATGNLLSSAPVIATCGPTITFRLTDLRNTIGTVTVANDARNVYVSYNVTSKDWYLAQTRLAVTKTLAKIPKDEAKSPKPWSFPFATDHDPVVTTFTYVVPLASVNATAGDDVIVAAMAGVVTPKNKKNRSDKWAWTVMWGLGNLSGKGLNTLHNYTVARCADAPPPVPATGGVVTITFDDGFKTAFTNAFPVLKGLGLRGNIAVNSQPIDEQWGDYMTLADLRTLKASGWSIVSHSVSHPHLPTLATSAEVEAEVRANKQWLEQHQFGPTSVFVVPFHEWGTRERDIIAKYHKYARGYTVNQFWPALYAKWPITTPLDLTGYEPEWAVPMPAGVPGYKTPEGRAATMEIVDRAAKEGEFVDIFFHQIPTADVPEFTLLMKDIAKYKANIRTYAEVVQQDRP